MVTDGLYARVHARHPQLARRMVQSFLDELPIYRQLPREQLEGEVMGLCEQNLRVFFTTLMEDRVPTVEELSEPRASAARLAQGRMPLDAVLAAYHIGARISWAELVAEARRPDETAQLVSAAETLLRYVAVVTGAVATAYVEEQQSIHGEERDVARGLAAALFAGEDATGLAARLGVVLAPAYVVLALELGQNRDEQAEGAAGAVAARRKVRRVQERLDAAAGEPVLGRLDASGGAVLLPARSVPHEQLAPLVREVSTAAGAQVRGAAAGPVPREQLPAAVEQACDVLGLVTRLGRPAGLYLLRDVLLEYQLTRPGLAVGELAVLLQPLERNRDLLRTLEAYLAHDSDRRRTAAALHVHPNTLDYRLKRIVDLTGLDPATTTGLQLLAAATTARRLQAPS